MKFIFVVVKSNVFDNRLIGIMNKSLNKLYGKKLKFSSFLTDF